MRNFKRKEAFRYQFKEPINARFKITKVNGNEVTSSIGEARILDLSPNGMKLNSHLKMNDADNKSVILFISFQINDEQLDLEGVILWKKNRGTTMDYGIDLITDEDMKGEITFQLKEFSRRAHQLKNQSAF